MVMKPKVILTANTDWYLYNFRIALAKYLREREIEVVLVSPMGKFVSKLQEQGFRWIRWEVGRQTITPWTEIVATYRLFQIYRQEQPNLVHHHTIKPCIYGSMAARILKNIGVVNSITGRGFVFLGDERKAKALRPFVKRIYRQAFNFPHGVIFENQTDKDYFLNEGLIRDAQAWLIEGVGVDPEKFSPLPEPEGPPVILFAARMLWDKGVGVLVEAARILHEMAPVRIVLVGEPDPGNPSSVDEATLREWDREGVIEWWGFRENMQDIYAQSHIVTLPTMYGEGVPTVLQEAAACQRAVVASDIPGCRHIVKDGYNGFITPPGDPVALAEALARLISDDNLRSQMGAAGRQYFLEKFTTDHVNSETLLVYDTVLPTPIFPKYNDGK